MFFRLFHTVGPQQIKLLDINKLLAAPIILNAEMAFNFMSNFLFKTC